MAHPYHHSLSSAKTHANSELSFQTPKWQDHFALHDWLDSSKFAFADARHRSLFHNPAGINIGAKIFKDIKKAKAIATQHITEDMGKVYQIKEWLPREFFPSHTLNNQKLEINDELSLTDLKGSLVYKNPFPSTIQPQITMGINLLLSPEKSEELEKKDPRRLFFFSSVGPYIVERLLGPTLNPNKGPTKENEKLLATRSVFEFFIQKAWGFIPSHQDIMAQRPIEDWMWKKARPLSKEL